MAYTGQRKLAFDAGFNDGLFQRPKSNPYNIDVVGGSYAAYEEGYAEGLISTNPPRGPAGEQGETGDSGPTGASGPAGSDGNFIHVGAGAPDNGLGNDGDQYVDADSGDIYTKITGSWALQGNGGNVALTTRLDIVDPAVVPTVSYRGDALPGTSEAGALWRITRITEESDGDIEILFADGNDNFDNIYDNRAALSYS